jgi:DNA polymerase (family 10)
LKSFRIPLGRAHLLAATLTREAKRLGVPVDQLVPLGSLRRYSPDVGDVSLLAVAPARWHGDVLDGFARLPSVTSVGALLPTSIEVATDRGRVRLHVSTPDDAGAALVWHTGSLRHTRELQTIAKKKGLTFQDGLLSRTNGVLVAAPDEADLYGQLGLPYIAPELREGQGEIEAAQRGGLPRLVSSSHIRGDLHMHTTWSDGRDNIQHMVLAAKQLGYEYVAITDHSERAFASRKLLALEIPIQRDEIDALRSRIHGIEILHGIEVDIMPNGSLDLADGVLAQLDFVIASVHAAVDLGAADMTARLVSAVRHPLVTVLGHPSGRYTHRARFDGYQFDVGAVCRAAAENGTLIEINANPRRLDPPEGLLRQFAEHDVGFVVSPDAHSPYRLDDTSLGVMLSRWARIPAQRVANTRQAGRMLRWLRDRKTLALNRLRL